MPGKVRLRVVEGPQQGKEFVFDKHDVFVFGRHSGCPIQLPPQDETASRYHFVLEINPPEVRLRDLGSLNGTFVGGIKYGGRAPSEPPTDGQSREYPQVAIRDGDEIQVGGTRLVCHIEPASIGDDSTRQAPQADAQRLGSANTERVSATHEAVDSAAAHLLREAPDDTPAPSGLPGYQTGELLNEGGFGAVYLGKRHSDGKTVAIKVMLPRIAVDPEARSRFLREVAIGKSLQHPHIVSLLDHGAGASGFFFVMEFCPGGSVADLMSRRGGRLGIQEACGIVLQALSGLAYAHDRGVVHRDLKPGNILLMDRDGEHAKLADYGLAKNFHQAGFSGMTLTGEVGGSPAFMPREQVTNFREVKPISDIWAMGATLYTMLTRQPCRDLPVGQDPVAAVLRSPIIPIRSRDPSLSPLLAAVVDRALANEPADRYQTAAEFAEALTRALAGRAR